MKRHIPLEDDERALTRKCISFCMARIAPSTVGQTPSDFFAREVATVQLRHLLDKFEEANTRTDGAVPKADYFAEARDDMGAAYIDLNSQASKPSYRKVAK